MTIQFKAFLLGMREFKSAMTTAYESDDIQECYDRGREWAHRLTLRLYDY